MLYCAGQVGRDSDMNVITSSLEDHFVMAWENVGKILHEAGTDYEHIIEIVTHHVGLQSHLMEFIEVKGRFVKPHPVPPTWTAIGVTELTFPGQVVEIKVTALIPD